MWKGKWMNDIRILDNARIITSTIPNPNSCSRRIPIKTRLNMLASTWTTPPCNHIQEKSRQTWCPWITLPTSRAPIFSNLNKYKNKKNFSIGTIHYSLQQCMTHEWNKVVFLGDERRRTHVEEEGPKRGFSLRGWNENLPRKEATQEP